MTSLAESISLPRHTARLYEIDDVDVEDFIEMEPTEEEMIPLEAREPPAPAQPPDVEVLPELPAEELPEEPPAEQLPEEPPAEELGIEECATEELAIEECATVVDPDEQALEPTTSQSSFEIPSSPAVSEELEESYPAEPFREQTALALDIRRDRTEPRGKIESSTFIPNEHSSYTVERA
jgi:hypothetical protein